MRIKIFIVIFLILLSVPSVIFAATIGDFLNPDKWQDILKENVVVPLSTSTFSTTTDLKNVEIKLPSPEEILKDSSPQLQEINKGVKEEVGIDLAKFTAWFAKVLRVVFDLVIRGLEMVSKSLQS